MQYTFKTKHLPIIINETLLHSKHEMMLEKMSNEAKYMTGLMVSCLRIPWGNQVKRSSKGCLLKSA